MRLTVLLMTGTVLQKPMYVSFFVDLSLDERLRASMLNTMVAEGHRSLSDFLSNAVLYELARLEARYNSGEPFVVRRPSSVPRGRPPELGTRLRDAGD